MTNAALVRSDGQGNYEPVNTFEEHQQILEVRQQEAMVSSQHDQRLGSEFQLSNDPSEMRASNQLELIQEAEQQMEGVELSDTTSVIEKRRPGRPRKNQS